MRISDWSSDVCSSDLIANDKIYQMGALDEQMRLYFGGEANRSMHLDSGRAIFERRIDGDDARSERMKARFVAVLRQDDRSKGYLAGRDFGGNRHVGALMLRSEEHTSELQSTMSH